MKTLPIELYRYFWDTKAEQIDVSKQDKYIISRLLDYGHTSAILWMKNQYDNEVIKDTLKTMKGISRKSAQFWAKKINMKEEEVKCLQTQYRQIPYGV